MSARATFPALAPQPAQQRTGGGIAAALDDVTASSAGGAPFLIAFGFTLAASAVLALFLPVKVAALVVLFQGNLALPLAFLLERRLALRRISGDDPLRPLAVQMAMSQIVALPVVLLVYGLQPAYVPGAMAAIGGGHFLPYTWLHRTRIYTVLGVAVSVGAFAICLWLGPRSFAPVLFYMSACYAAAAPLLLRHARRMVDRGTA